MATVTMSEDDMAGIRAIHAVLADRASEPLPTIFFFHGFNTSSKEITSYFGYMLALAGFRVILPEADLHGARFDGDEPARLHQFWRIVKRSIDELPRYRDHYADQGLIDNGRIGIGGTSMGGFVTLGALARHDWVRAAASYMGSGYYLDLSRALFPPLGTFNTANAAQHDEQMQSLREYDIADQLERIANRPLLVWHGERDDVVPFAEAARLRNELTQRDLAANLQFIAEPLAGHRITDKSAVAGARFFSAHL
jgi:hypothetical protein